MISFLISLGIYLIYNLVCLIKFKVPTSLSETHYHLIGESKKNEVIFTLILWAISIPIMITGFDITPANYQFLIFLSAGALMFVGAAPFFKRGGLENKVHVYSAIFTGICSILWSFFVGNLYITVVALILMLIIVIVKTTKRTYLIETILFLNLYIQVFLILINK